MAAAGSEPSVGSSGDSYDDALAESVIGLFKTEEIYRRGPWKGLEEVEFATLEWVAWYNHRRLLEPLGYVPAAEFEQAYDDRQIAPDSMAVLNSSSLRETRGGSAERAGVAVGLRLAEVWARLTIPWTGKPVTIPGEAGRIFSGFTRGGAWRAIPGVVEEKKGESAGRPAVHDAK